MHFASVRRDDRRESLRLVYFSCFPFWHPYFILKLTCFPVVVFFFLLSSFQGFPQLLKWVSELCIKSGSWEPELCWLASTASLSLASTNSLYGSDIEHKLITLARSIQRTRISRPSSRPVCDWLLGKGRKMCEYETEKSHWHALVLTKAIGGWSAGPQLCRLRLVCTHLSSTLWASRDAVVVVVVVVVNVVVKKVRW